MISTSFLWAVGLFIFGSLAGFFRKVAFQVKGPGQNGHIHNFEKPWFTTLQTTIGCVLSLTVYHISVKWSKSKPRRRSSDDGVDDASNHVNDNPKEYMLATDGKHDDVTHQRKRITVYEYKQMRSISFSRQGPDHQQDPGKVTWPKLKKLLLPSLLYQLGVVTQGVGLRYTSASVNQILSGSGIVFTAIFSFWFLKRTLNWRHWTGLAVSCVGIGIVSTAEIFIPVKPHIRLDPSATFWIEEEYDANATKVAFGVYMTVFSQVVSAAQMVWEEAYLSDLQLHPLQVMGWEGIWGLGMDLAVLMPLAHWLPGPDYGNHEENSADTAIMLTHSWVVAAVAGLFLVTVAGTSQIGIMVSQRLGSVFRAILLTARTALIWVLDLLVFYCHVGPEGIGEAWTAASPWQGAGFILLLLGTCIYAMEPKVRAATTPSSKPRLSSHLSADLDSPAAFRVAHGSHASHAGYQPLAQEPESQRK